MEISRPEAILIVADDERYVRALAQELRSLGFPFVYRATSAPEAMAMLDRVHPTLMLTNIVEHGKSGREIVARAKELGASVAVIGSRADLLTEEFEIPLEDKSKLTGDVLKALVFDLISHARRRSRDSVRMSQTRVA